MLKSTAENDALAFLKSATNFTLDTIHHVMILGKEGRERSFGFLEAFIAEILGDPNNFGGEGGRNLLSEKQELLNAARVAKAKVGKRIGVAQH
jgi:hypothetical protein